MSNIKKRLDRVLKTLDDKSITDVAYDTFKDVTPVRTGNAKSNTKKSGNNILANYPYATILDRGRHLTNKGMRGSDQAPEGMSKPTIEEIRAHVLKTLGIRI
jgi:hypothetical protein